MASEEMTSKRNYDYKSIIPSPDAIDQGILQHLHAVSMHVVWSMRCHELKIPLELENLENRLKLWGESLFDEDCPLDSVVRSSNQKEEILRQRLISSLARILYTLGKERTTRNCDHV